MRGHLIADIDPLRLMPVQNHPELDLVARLRASLRAQRLADAIPTIPDVVARATTAGAVSRPGARVAPSRLLLEILRARRGTDLVIRHRPAPLLAAIHLVGSVLLAPLVELAGYLLLVLALVTGGAAGWYVPLFLLAVPGFALLLSLWAIALEMALAGDAATWPRAIGLAVLAVAEQVGHRQWRMVEGVHGVLSGLRGGSRHDASDIGAAASDEDLALAATERVQTR